MSDTSEFPKLPKGYHWTVDLTRTLSLRKVTVKIKGRIFTHASFYEYLHDFSEPREAALSAAKDAHRYFQRHDRDLVIRQSLGEYQDELNEAAHS